MGVHTLQAKCKHTDWIWDQKFHQTTPANTLIYVPCKTLMCLLHEQHVLQPLDSISLEFSSGLQELMAVSWSQSPRTWFYEMLQ